LVVEVVEHSHDVSLFLAGWGIMEEIQKTPTTYLHCGLLGKSIRWEILRN